MPKQKQKLTQKEQSERFKKAVHDLVAAGELNPTEADAAFEKLMKNLKTNQPKDS